MFQRFPSLTRFSQGWTITEKIDGSNAQIWIDTLSSADDKPVRDEFSLGTLPDPANPEREFHVIAGSRNRFLTPDKGDNMAFAGWVKDNLEMLVRTLGEGRHFGEWWGIGIQRGYGLRERRFSLFNAIRWKQEELPEGLYVVPSGFLNEYVADPGAAALAYMNHLKENGSEAAPGFMDPEGVVMHHRASGASFKKTFDYDEFGKWKENQGRREA